MARSLFVLLLLAAVTVWARRAARTPAATLAGGPGLRGWVWLALGVSIQVVWVRLLSRWTAAPMPLHWLPTVAVLCALWFVWLNRAYRGLWIVVAGAALNLAVMLGNGGLMPVSPATLHALGDPRAPGQAALALSKNRVIQEDVTRLGALDDRHIVVVAGVHVAFSLGDALVAAGCALTLGEALYRAAQCSRSLGVEVPGARRQPGMAS